MNIILLPFMFISLYEYFDHIHKHLDLCSIHIIGLGLKEFVMKYLDFTTNSKKPSLLFQKFSFLWSLNSFLHKISIELFESFIHFLEISIL